MRTSDYNLKGSTVSEVYDLLQTEGDTSLTKYANGSFILSKPSQNSELREIKFRKFTPIMNKSLATLSKQNAEMTITPRFLKSTKTPGTFSYTTHFTRDTNSGADLNLHYGNVTINKGPTNLVARISTTKHSLSLPLNKGGFDDYVYDFTFTLPVENNLKICRRVYLSSESIALFDQNIHAFEGSNTTIINKRMDEWVTGSRNYVEHESYGTFMILFVYHDNAEDVRPAGFGYVDIAVYFWPSMSEYRDAYENNQAFMQFEQEHPANPNLISIERLDVWGRDQCDNYMRTNTLWATKVYNYKAQMLNIDESRCTAFTYANGTNMAIKPATLKTVLIGNADEICSNINEKLAGYFSNFKPSSTFHVVDSDYNTWVLAQYVDDPINYGVQTGYTYDASGMKISDYYNWANMILTTRQQKELFNPELKGQFAQVVPQCYFTRIYSKIEKSKTPSDTYEHTLLNTVFGVHNMNFCLRQFKNEIDSLTKSNASAECLWMYFDVEIHCDTDIFNISRDRMWHNTYERIRDAQWSDLAACFYGYNQCISTNEDTLTNLIYANYLAHGLDIILKSPLMNNISNTIFVNETESQVIMKHTQQFSTANCINVYITDIEGNNIEIDYLKRIYRSIMLEIDYIFG